jgi:hypothetical protein
MVSAVLIPADALALQFAVAASGSTAMVVERCIQRLAVAEADGGDGGLRGLATSSHPENTVCTRPASCPRR